MIQASVGPVHYRSALDGREAVHIVPEDTSQGFCQKPHVCCQYYLESVELMDSWNHTMILPVAHNALLPTSQLTFTVWDVSGLGKAVVVGGTTMRLFTPKRLVQVGWNRTHDYPGRYVGDSNGCFYTGAKRRTRPGTRRHRANRPASRTRWADWKRQVV